MIKKKEQCCGCGACAQACPQNCIAMESDREGFLYPQIAEEGCVSCGLCEKVCPVLGKDSAGNHVPDCYVGYAKNEGIRACSSSGGIFSLLAESVLDSGGVLYGAATDEGQMVRHIRVDSASGLCMLRGSKYLQSRIGDTFSEAKEDLDAGRAVLYSGTACQTAGLRRFLGKDYEKLYMVDVLCHGVPSPAVWKKYLEWQAKKHSAGSVRQVFFRNKQCGWKNYSLELIFDNGRRYMESHRDDVFMQLFLENVCLRPSCHDCSFKGLDRMSDLTIGDAWGVEQVDPEMDDDRGTSIILVHSLKGRKLLGEAAPGILMHQADLDRILPPDADSRKSVAAHSGRKGFFRVLGLFGTGAFSAWQLRNVCRRIKRKIKK